MHSSCHSRTGPRLVLTLDAGEGVHLLPASRTPALGNSRSHNPEPAVLAILPPANYPAAIPGMEDELHLDAFQDS